MGLTRRKFLKTAGLTAGAVGLGLNGFDFSAWAQVQQDSEVVKRPSLCNVCASHCGMWIHVKNDRIWKVTGHEENGRSLGRLCPRAHGGIDWVYDPYRLKQPIKLEEDGSIRPIGWNQALDEIAEKLTKILEEEGPEKVFYAHNPRKTGVFYGNRFMHALNVSTIMTHNAACNTGRGRGFGATMGGVPSPDIGNSKYVVIIGRNYGAGIRTSQLKKINKAVKGDTTMVCVDPRQNETSLIADKWVPIKPGTDLAMVLAMCKVIIDDDAYDHEFIEEYTIGFDQFANSLDEYTPEWAEGLTDVPADTIREMARGLADAAPAALVDPSWKGAFGCTYENSTETARAVAYLNALLGNINQDGGLKFYNGPANGKLDPDKYPAPAAPDTKRADGAGVEGEYPLATGHGLPHVVAERIKEGKIKAGFVRHHNPVRNIPDYDHMKEGFGALDLLVVFETQMSETAMVADYVLPEPSFAEREEIIESRGGSRGTLAMRTQAIPKMYSKTRSFDEIIRDLALRMGVGEYFKFTMDEANAAILEPFDINLIEFKEKGSMLVDLPQPEPWPELSTPSGKYEFYSETFEKHGAPPVVSWLPPATGLEFGDNEFRLVHGKEAFHSHTATANTPQLLQITKDYDTNRLWINASVAKEMGIEDGDEVRISSDIFSDTTRVKVTERIHPETVYYPAGYGNRTSHYRIANEIDSLNPNDFVKYQVESIVGHVMVNEVIVKVEKV
ncbi:MAG: molybdopterin-dependent oxidoreductase [Halarsenatibacteraceae bacterium]